MQLCDEKDEAGNCSDVEEIAAPVRVRPPPAPSTATSHAYPSSSAPGSSSSSSSSSPSSSLSPTVASGSGGPTRDYLEVSSDDDEEKEEEKQMMETPAPTRPLSSLHQPHQPASPSCSTSSSSPGPSSSPPAPESVAVNPAQRWEPVPVEGRFVQGKNARRPMYRCPVPGCSKKGSTGMSSAPSPDSSGAYEGTKAHVKHHISSVHNKDKPYPCTWPGCPQAFPTKRHLDDHRRTHTGEKPYVCTWPGCPKAFALQSNLTAHLLVHVHTGDKPYKCTADIAKCTKAYTSKHALLDHVAACHNGEPRWQCPHAECGEWFNSSSDRSLHVRQAHQGKTWACPVVGCDVQSHSPSVRAWHVLSVHQHGTPQYDAYMARQREYGANRRRRQRLARVQRAVAETMVRKKVEQDSGVQRDVQPLTKDEPRGIIGEYAESAYHAVRLANALPDTTTTDDHLTRRGVMRTPGQVVTQLYPEVKTVPIADAVGLPIRVLHLLSNSVHGHFGMNAAGTDTAVTLKALFAAMTVAGIRQGHVISDASPIITHPAWCAAVVDGADCRSVVNASVSAAIGSGALVLVAYGAQVRRCFTAERLRSLGVRRGRERRVGGLTVYDVVRSDDGCGLMVVECEHPSAHTDHQQVYSAVALTEQLCSGASDGPAERAIADIRREADDVAAHEELQALAVERGKGAGEVEASAGEAEPETERQPEAAQAEEQAAPVADLPRCHVLPFPLSPSPSPLPSLSLLSLRLSLHPLQLRLLRGVASAPRHSPFPLQLRALHLLQHGVAMRCGALLRGRLQRQRASGALHFVRLPWALEVPPLIALPLSYPPVPTPLPPPFHFTRGCTFSLLHPALPPPFLLRCLRVARVHTGPCGPMAPAPLLPPPPPSTHPLPLPLPLLLPLYPP